MYAFFYLLLSCMIVSVVLGSLRDKRQQRTVIERTVINNFGGRGFNRQPWGGPRFPYRNPGYGFNSGSGYNRGHFGGPPPTTIVKTTVIRNG